VAPKHVLTTQIYKGAMPFVFIQLLMLIILWLYPELATFLPKVIYN
jgi:TRAP-type mannitol/chloroaromatic compound transport system permease large subunit